MEELVSLIDLVSKNKVKRIDLLGDNKSPTSKVNDLYFKLSSREFNKEEEAIKFYYGDNVNREIYFNKLKRKLTERLINTVFFIDVNQPNFTEVQRAYYTCYKNIAAFKILLGRYARRPAVSLAEKTLKKAIHFEFTDIVLAIAKDLRVHYGTLIGNNRKFKLYNDLVKKYSAIQMAELTAEEYYTELMINFIGSKSTKGDVLLKAKLFSSELREVIKIHQSYRLNFVSHIIFVLKYEIANDYVNTLKICKEALELFEGKKHLTSPAAIFLFLAKMLASHIQLKNFEEGEVVAQKCLEILPEGSGNWYIALRHYMILCFHSSQFNKANEIYHLGLNNSNFKKQFKSISEYWRMYEAFIYYFIHIKKIIPNSNKKLKRFRVSKFLNEVPTFSKDKRGVNITILIIQILFLLQQKKYGQIIDRMESLKTYTHRYLRKDDTFRSNCFIKMLLCLPIANFHKKAVIRKAQKYKDKLDSVPLNEANQSAEIEIVPYEMLWRFVLESLDEKWH